MGDLTGFEPRGSEPQTPARGRMAVRRSALETVVFRVTTLPFALGVTVITTRVLNPAGRGTVVIALLVVSVAAALVGSIGVAVTHEIGRQSAGHRPVIGAGLALSALAGAVTTVVMVAGLLNVIHADRAITIGALGLPAVVVRQELTAGLVALGRTRFSNLTQLLVQMVTVAAMLVFVVLRHGGVDAAVGSWLLAQWAISAATIVHCRNLIGRPHMEMLRRLVGLGATAGLGNLVSLSNYRVELVILGAYRGVSDIGIYSLASSLAELLWLGSAGIATATVAPIVGEAGDRAVQTACAAIRHTLIVTAAGGLVVGVAGTVLIPRVFGDSFTQSTVLLLLLVPGIVAYAPGGVLGVYLSMRLGRARYTLGVSIISALTTALLALVLVPFIGSVGAALSCDAGYVTGILFGLYWFLRLSAAPPRGLLPRPGDLVAYARLLRLPSFSRGGP